MQVTNKQMCLGHTHYYYYYYYYHSYYYYK